MPRNMRKFTCFNCQLHVRAARVSHFLDLFCACSAAFLNLAFMNSSSLLSFHQVGQIVPGQCLAQLMAMPLAIVRSWGEHAVFITEQTSRCCMVCLMPKSQVSCSFENPYFNMFTLDRPTCVRNRLSAHQVVQGFFAPAGTCSSALMLMCTLALRIFKFNRI